MLSNELTLLKKMHDGADPTCYAGILHRWDLDNANPHRVKYAPDTINQEMYDLLFPFPEFYERSQEIIEDCKEDVYFTINSFYRRNKNSHDVRHLNCFILDFDYYKIDKYQNLTANQFYSKIKNKFKINPTAVVDSGRGLYIIYCFKHCSYHMSRLYKQIYKQMQLKYEKYGMDPNATHITQVIRLPGTINSKSLQTVEVIELNDTDYTIQQFAELYLPYTQEESKKYNSNKKNISKTISLAYRDPMFKSLYNDLQKLIVLRNRTGNCKGYRETMLYLVREYATWAGFSIDESVKLALALNETLHCPLTDQEVEKQCRPSRNRRRTSIDTIINKLQITREEQLELSFLRRKDLKKSIKAKMKRRNKLTNMTDKQEEVLRRRTSIIELKRQGYRNKTIAEKLEIDKGTVSKDLKFIKNNPSKFIYKLQDYIQHITVNLNDINFLRNTQYSKTKQLSDWLEMALTALEFLVRDLGVAKN